MIKYKKISCTAAVFMLSVIMVSLLSGFHTDAFLTDDNRTQWYPVIERAYGDFLSTGKMPVYDFFQFKGMPIIEEGYYGITNPLMLIAYLLVSVLPVNFSCITMYIVLEVAIGNCFFFWLCHSLRSNLVSSGLLTAAYSVMASFYSFSYWYYVFNNYMFIPMLLYVFLKTRKSRTAYFGCGVVLAAEILMGNIQYVFYHYIIFGLMCLTYLIMKKKEYIVICISNLTCAVVLSSPFLIMAVSLSGGFNTNGFNSMSLDSYDLFIGSVLPTGILSFFSIPKELFAFSICMGRFDRTWLYNGGIAIIWVVVMVYGVKSIFGSGGIYGRLKKSDLYHEKSLKKIALAFKRFICAKYSKLFIHKDGNYIFMNGIAVCLLFFILFVMNLFVAKILGAVPIINHFRYLFKCIFVIQPLTAVITASVMPEIKGTLRKYAVTFCALFTVVGIVNNVGTMWTVPQLYTEVDMPSVEEQKAYSDNLKTEYMPDLDRYRNIVLHKNISSINPTSFRIYKGYLRNYATTAGVFSIAGYEMSISDDRLSQIKTIYPVDSKKGIVKMFGIGEESDFWKNAVKNAQKLKKSMAANGVKYILVQKDEGNETFKLYTNKGWELATPYIPNSHDEDLTSEILETLQSIGVIKIEGVRSLDDEFNIIVLKNPVGICTDGANDLPVSAERMDLVTFEANGSDTYTLSFAYDAGIIAYTADDGKHLDTSCDKNGNIIINASGVDSGKICLGYKKNIYIVAFIFEVVISVFLIITLILIGKKGRSEK